MKYLQARYLLISSCLVVSGCGVMSKVTEPVSLEAMSTELSPGRYEISAVSDKNMPGNLRFEEKAREACGGDFTIEERSSPPRVVGTVQCTTKDAATARAQLKASQQKLIEMGYNPGPADGLMGNRTSQAIKKFQTDYKLAPTGILDTKTLKALMM